eukprot:71011_1
MSIRMYFHKLIASQNTEFYEFAEWLHQKTPQEVVNITLDEFQRKANNTFQQKILKMLQTLAPSTINTNALKTIINSKITQTLLRLAMITVTLSLDAFHLQIFSMDSDLMHKYGSTIKIFVLVAMILFV